MTRKTPKASAIANLKKALEPFANALNSLDLSQLDEDMEEVYLYIGKRDKLGSKPHLKLADFENAKDILGE